ncbi:hypothetical protein PVK06_035697 [Gossypium arboreum]|uniref:Uncharacterized protein n=1 Tax=Gossypium arboreum TaxID=29729 RepID=A0ABR0NHH4_GOSAR|nr:hypothetical protein PVK06_035697 [Gossypium arboreum]
MELTTFVGPKGWSLFFELLEVDYVLFNPPITLEHKDFVIVPRYLDVDATKKYRVDDVGVKKYVIVKWLKFQMPDDNPIMDQVHVYEKLASDILAKGMEMCEFSKQTS